jgi:glycosyltransferase involved in cell wall biosynthesis
MKIGIIIPAYNEKNNISKLVRDLKPKNCDILVIDDGSTDSTAAIAESEGVIIIRHEKRMGKGVSLRDGFNFALKNSYEAVITMDGDGQHSADDVSKFIDCAREIKADVVIGNRMGNPHRMPLLRIITNAAMSKLISGLCRQHIPDSQCGFRLISLEVLRNISLDSSNFEIESEILIEASKRGFRIASIPIRSIYHGGKSKINPFLDTLRFLKFIVKKLWTLKR